MFHFAGEGQVGLTLQPPPGPQTKMVSTSAVLSSGLPPRRSRGNCLACKLRAQRFEIFINRHIQLE